MSADEGDGAIDPCAKGPSQKIHRQKTRRRDGPGAVASGLAYPRRMLRPFTFLRCARIIAVLLVACGGAQQTPSEPATTAPKAPPAPTPSTALIAPAVGTTRPRSFADDLAF